MADALPKLTKAQMARLITVAADDMPFASVKPAATAVCVEAGVLEEFSCIRSGGRYRMVRLTPLGARVLAGLPGEAFERFRRMVEKHDA